MSQRMNIRVEHSPSLAEIEQSTKRVTQSWEIIYIDGYPSILVGSGMDMADFIAKALVDYKGYGR